VFDCTPAFLLSTITVVIKYSKSVLCVSELSRVLQPQFFPEIQTDTFAITILCDRSLLYDKQTVPRHAIYSAFGNDVTSKIVVLFFGTRTFWENQTRWSADIHQYKRLSIQVYGPISPSRKTTIPVSAYRHLWSAEPDYI